MKTTVRSQQSRERNPTSNRSLTPIDLFCVQWRGARSPSAGFLLATCLALPFCVFTPPARAQTATVEFASPTYTVNELGGRLIITLVRSAARPNDYASVLVYVSGGTATFGEDYYGFDPHGYQISF